MRRIATVLALAALPALTVQPASAQTSIGQVQQFGVASTVLYLPFWVSVGGSFNIATSGPALIDPFIRLFDGIAFGGSDLGTQLAFNDDGGIWNAGDYNSCTGTNSTCHSLISMFLNPGAYTVASSVWDFTEAEARAGVNGLADNSPCVADGDFSDCLYDLSITSADGTASVTPEPSAILLLATGLLGIGIVARRRREETHSL